jgi:hypothetical protein
MSLAVTLSEMAQVFDEARRSGVTLRPQHYRVMSACLRQLAVTVGELEAGSPASPQPAPGVVVDLCDHLRAGPVTMGQLLGPNGRLAKVIPLPVVRIERHELPAGDA